MATRIDRRSRSLDEMSDGEAGLLAVGVIGGLAALMVLSLIAIALYASGWGYTLTF